MPMCISDLMVDLRALELSFLRIPRTHETPSNSSTATSGKVVYLKFAKTALLAAAVAWVSVVVEDTEEVCVVALAAVEASVLVAAVEASASADVGVSAVALLEAAPEVVLPVVVLILLPRQQSPRMPSPTMRLQGRNEMTSFMFEM